MPRIAANPSGPNPMLPLFTLLFATVALIILELLREHGAAGRDIDSDSD